MNKQGLEASIHKLKLEWIMAKDETERRQISEEIHKQLGPRGTK